MNKFKIIPVLIFLCTLVSCGKVDLVRNNPLDPKSPDYKPVELVTSAVSAVTNSSAVTGGKVTTQTGVSIITRGVCWNLTTNPTISNSKTSDGSGTGSYISYIKGLTASKTYYVRAYATCSAGTFYGLNVTLNTLASATAPVLTTTAATSIGLITAVSGGTISSDGGSAVTERGICWGTAVNPSIILSTKTSDSLGVGTFTSSLTGLTPNTLYHVRAYATNSIGTSYGSDLTFTTLLTAVTPTVTTTTVTGISMTVALSGGTVTFDGGASVTNRGVCWGTGLNPTISLPTKTSDGTGSGSFSSILTPLTPGVLYHVRAFATNSVGTTYGSDLTFTTSTVATVPSVTTTAISSVSSTTATSGGNIISDGGASVTIRGVCWNTITSPTTANSKTSNGTGTGTFVSNLTGLTTNTKYYVRAYATNSVGTSCGNEIIFTTTANTPTVSTTAASAITATTATSGGNVSTDGGASVTDRGVCWNTVTAPTTANNKTTDANGTGIYISSLTGLTGGTKYYVRAYATNSAGTAYGNEINFTTTAIIPTLSPTNAASSITSSSAVSGGNIISDGGAAVTVSGICWGTTSNPLATGSRTTDGTTTGAFSSSITGLAANTLYYVRAYATNSIGTGYGTQVSFTTSATVVIGELYQGGKVAYILQSGDPGYIAGQTHGLIAAPSDQSTGIQWYNGSYTVTGATATALGTGNANTNNIVTSQGVGNYAAKLCSDLVLGGFSDWYLPSKDELNKLYLNRTVIGGFTISLYWSSSEYSNNYAWYQSFNDGIQNYVNGKANTMDVRAIRAF
jgi:hypothetical protein